MLSSIQTNELPWIPRVRLSSAAQCRPNIEATDIPCFAVEVLEGNQHRLTEESGGYLVRYGCENDYDPCPKWTKFVETGENVVHVDTTGIDTVPLTLIMELLAGLVEKNL